MTRLRLLSCVAGVVLVALAALWFVSNYEQVETRVRVGASREAQTNPYLAAMRFIDRVGFRSELVERASIFDSPPAAATLVLLAGRAALTPARVASLLRWVEGGGHLVVEPEPIRHRDLLLDAIAIDRLATTEAKPARITRFVWPGADEPLAVTTIRDVVLDVKRVEAELLVTDAAGPRLVSMRRGAGRVTVVSGMRRFHNRVIGEHDNAEMLRRILALAGSNQSVVLVRAPQALPLWAWLQQQALGSVVAAVVLLLLWLWHVSPRLGPMADPGGVQRKELLQHILACGRFRWAQGARAALLGAARDICQRHIVAFEPRLAHLPSDRRYQELSPHLGTSPEVIARAFEAAPHGTREFVQIVATLASIHAGLSGAGRSRLRRKRT